MNEELAKYYWRITHTLHRLTMDESFLFQRLGIGLLLGLLVGLQRERAASGLGGVRTFPLITLLGGVTAVLASHFGGWVVAAALLGIAILVGVANVIRRDKNDGGITTEIAILLLFALGAMLVVAPPAVAVAIGGAAALLLHFKPELHGFAAKLDPPDVRAIMQFVLISCIVLPVLPNRPYGPFGVFNPFQLWLMVVLIVGISLVAYVIYKFFGTDAGTILGGLLGGAISSTATAVSYARRTRDQAALAPSAAVVIQLASAVLYLRVLIEISAVAANFLPSALLPIGIMGIITLLPGLFFWLFTRRQETEMPEQKNPSELKSALVFAGIFLVVSLALAAAKQWYGGRGLFAVAVLSGLTDMDAITLGTARMVKQQTLEASAAWRLIVIASLANLAFKAGIVAVLGTGRLLVYVLLLFAVPVLGGLLLVALWPDQWTVDALVPLLAPPSQPS